MSQNLRREVAERTFDLIASYERKAANVLTVNRCEGAEMFTGILFGLADCLRAELVKYCLLTTDKDERDQLLRTFRDLLNEFLTVENIDKVEKEFMEFKEKVNG
jgi:hypothetical protein